MKHAFDVIEGEVKKERQVNNELEKNLLELRSEHLSVVEERDKYLAIIGITGKID